MFREMQREGESRHPSLVAGLPACLLPPSSLPWAFREVRTGRSRRVPTAGSARRRGEMSAVQQLRLERVFLVCI